MSQSRKKAAKERRSPCRSLLSFNQSLFNLVKAGNLANLPVMVDFGRVSGDKNIQKLLLEKLRPGDIYTHCYSGLRGELADGKLNPAIMAARKRGVFFDLGHGAGSFFSEPAGHRHAGENIPTSHNAPSSCKFQSFTFQKLI